MRPEERMQRLLKLILVVGIGVLLFTFIYPLYKSYQPTLPQNLGVGEIINEEVWEAAKGYPYDAPRVDTRKSRKSQKKTADEAEEAEEDSPYLAPINQPLIYQPVEETEVELEEELEEEVEEERVREEVPDYFEGRDRFAIDRPFQDVDLPEGDVEALDREEAERFGQVERGPRIQYDDEDTGPSSGYAQSATPPKPSAKELRYMEKGWQKFSAHKGGFTVWVPGDLYYVVSNNGGKTEVYQCDANGIYYGLQRRKLDQDLKGYGDPQVRNIIRKAYEEWQEDFATGIPGFRLVSSAFIKDTDHRRTDYLMGADAGQVRLRIFVKDGYMFWMWTVYRHEDKQRADHNMYVNSIEMPKEDNGTRRR